MTLTSLELPRKQGRENTYVGIYGPTEVCLCLKGCIALVNVH